MTYEDEFDDMSADELREVLRERQAQQQAQDAQQDLSGLENLSVHERAALEAQARKVSQNISNAISEKSRQSAEATLNLRLEEIKAQTGLINLSPHIIEEEKRKMRSEGITIW